MRTQGTPVQDHAVATTPPIIFHDGTSGSVDLRRLINSQRAGVFAELRDPTIFSAVRVDQGAVTWPSGIDLAPDAMYNALRTTGHWSPE